MLTAQQTGFMPIIISLMSIRINAVDLKVLNQILSSKIHGLRVSNAKGQDFYFEAISTQLINYHNTNYIHVEFNSDCQSVIDHYPMMNFDLDPLSFDLQPVHIEVFVDSGADVFIHASTSFNFSNLRTEKEVGVNAVRECNFVKINHNHSTQKSS
ncbi:MULTISPECIES: hypothetical protein [Vibrio]|uniref:Uncharacterized protein n=1 Tax=Vibrio tasmaniensis TaxID=212663 RepID=A0A2N7NCT5_9VIBR|nr:hypothetical protein [Vibrio tasmaniensis]PMO89838.1 hypothetical protein BCT01_00725 [Vibrio tasmaniensis]PMP09989.1 hypothetical protein BCS92_02365 [Vibrio tasmaniensis]TKG32627.1 hypothetical protein FC057_12485 [Vibrio tasmaniensis]TKG41689.1 hypothetical protein FC063_07455 [Vibrio tasmaniensis]TKG52044.1 hypothetical protein FC070_09725 [Vibrio tasmaniensis]